MIEHISIDIVTHIISSTFSKFFFVYSASEVCYGQGKKLNFFSPQYIRQFSQWFLLPNSAFSPWHDAITYGILLLNRVCGLAAPLLFSASIYSSYSCYSPTVVACWLSRMWLDCPTWQVQSLYLNGGIWLALVNGIWADMR